MKPYGVISDTHLHNWSAFSTVLASGVNSRLDMILAETCRCAEEVKKAGGDTIIHAGDLFHVRGSIAPSVLNPTLDCYRALILSGFKVVIVAGNHDLEGKEARRISSAITALEGIGCTVVNDLHQEAGMLMIPWQTTTDELKVKIEKFPVAERKNIDLIIHAPIDRVIVGIPDHGLEPEWLQERGYKHVFAGHYHHHKDFGKGVYSIGSLCHHTWSDIGTKAGFLVVTDSEVKWFKSHAPEFVEIGAETDPGDIPLIVDGNYVRASLTSATSTDVEETRQFLTDSGAKGVIVVAHKDTVAPERGGAITIKTGATIDASVGDYIKNQAYANAEKLSVLCGEILNEARGV